MGTSYSKTFTDVDGCSHSISYEYGSIWLGNDQSEAEITPETACAMAYELRLVARIAEAARRGNAAQGVNTSQESGT